MTDRAALEAEQLRLLRRLLGALAGDNGFYTPRLRRAGLDGTIEDLHALERLEPTTKDALVADQKAHPPYGTNLTYPLEHYQRFHQTSGTSGVPLVWLDTRESWSWMVDTWCEVLRVAGLGSDDRLLVPFSFGPFLGFWAAFDAGRRLGCLTLPGGGMSSAARVRLLDAHRVTAICCTPTYALHLAEVAAAEGVDLAASTVRTVVVAGEPGGSIPETRRQIAERWGARVFDHHGMTEVGPVSVPNPEHPDVLHVLESAYIAEIVDPESGRAVAPGEIGELWLTTLGRLGSPLLRYRTGDLVRRSRRSPEVLGRVDLALEGGILARVDDMVVVRGVNLYPSAVEAVVRRAAGGAEYRVELDRSRALVEVRVELEVPNGDDAGEAVADLERALRDAFQLRIPVTPVSAGALPRFELKARRWLRRETD